MLKSPQVYTVFQTHTDKQSRRQQTVSRETRSLNHIDSRIGNIQTREEKKRAGPLSAIRLLPDDHPQPYKMRNTGCPVLPYYTAMLHFCQHILKKNTEFLKKITLEKPLISLYYNKIHITTCFLYRPYPLHRRLRGRCRPDNRVRPL